ncbi:ribonuclease HII [Terribacillus saccharophilus]|uniref:ribonuclease HII n=1 Tax=Terribacillus saccharophilus TaxID=361277 RepID=UPI000BA5CFFC|nr:ribonuclease HII [Terribacillus saccharophilus]PAF40223.1 ribonuclease HII [Terribacillus saccharophilus]
MKDVLTIQQIRAHLQEGTYSEEMLSSWQEDHRTGVQKLMDAHKRKLVKEQELREQYDHMCSFENAYYAKGKQYIAGIDEAGRGPLAGPVVAAAVILPRDAYIAGLNDSKQLSEAKREALYEQIINTCIAYGVGIVTSQRIDEINIYQAAKQAMLEAVDELECQPDHVLVDAMPLSELTCTYESLIKGDQRSVSIAAASIIAKVTRDRMMKEADTAYPGYGFKDHMGYGTKQHLEALRKQGITPLHRLSFAPVKDLSRV